MSCPTRAQGDGCAGPANRPRAVPARLREIADACDVEIDPGSIPRLCAAHGLTHR